MVDVSVTVNIVVGDSEMEIRRAANIVRVGDINGAVRNFMRGAGRAVAGAYADDIKEEVELDEHECGPAC